MKIIFGEFHKETEGLTVLAKREKYELYVKTNVFNLLKKCYTDCSSKKIEFYTESLKSWASFYESDLLLLNLFFEKNNGFIINSLCRSNAFENINSANLSQLSEAFLEYINRINESTSDFDSSNEKEFVQDSFIELVPGVTKIDWIHEEGVNPLIRKFSAWFKENLYLEDLDSIIFGFLIFTKAWDTFDQFSSPFNNKKAIVLYDEINSDIEARLSILNASIYIELLNGIKKVISGLIFDLNYIPLLDNQDSLEYSEGYLKKRSDNQRLINDVVQMEKISPFNSYFELIKNVSNETPAYMYAKYMSSILEKIKQLSYPSKDEISKINEIAANGCVNSLRQKLFQKLYIF